MRHELPPSVLSRRVIVYVRQSTNIQVTENLESQRRQYELAELHRSRCAAPPGCRSWCGLERTDHDRRTKQRLVRALIESDRQVTRSVLEGLIELYRSAPGIASRACRRRLARDSRRTSSGLRLPNGECDSKLPDHRRLANAPKEPGCCRVYRLPVGASFDVGLHAGEPEWRR